MITLFFVAVALGGMDSNPEFYTPNEQLLFGARYHDIHYVRKALSNGADPNCKDTWGNTPLLLACQWQLITWCTSLHVYFFYRKQLQVVDYLLNHGAHLDAKNEAGETALDIAADVVEDHYLFNGHLINHLLARGARSDEFTDKYNLEDLRKNSRLKSSIDYYLQSPSLMAQVGKLLAGISYGYSYR